MRTAAVALAAGVAAVLVTGCGGHPATPATRQAGTAGPAPALPLCQTPSLSVALDAAQTGSTAGSTYIPLTFGNDSHGRCELGGYPGVSFVTGHGGDQIGAAAAHDPGYPVTRVVIPAGGSAHAWLRISAAQNYPPPACDQVTAAELRVYPPGSSVPAYLRHSFAACRSAATPVLSVLPVRAGQGFRGTIP